MEVAELKTIRLEIATCTLETPTNKSALAITRKQSHSLTPHHLLFDNMLGMMVNELLKEGNDDYQIRFKLVTRFNYYYKRKKVTIKDIEYVHFNKDQLHGMVNLLTLAALEELYLPKEMYEKLKELPLERSKKQSWNHMPTDESRKKMSSEVAMFVVKMILNVMESGDYSLYIASKRLEERGLSDEINELMEIKTDRMTNEKMNLIGEEKRKEVIERIDSVATVNHMRKSARFGYPEEDSIPVSTEVEKSELGDYIDRVIKGERMHLTKEEYTIRSIIDKEVIDIFMRSL